MAKIKREQTISLQWYREGNDPYLTNINKPEVYWFVENGIKKKFDSLEAMKAELSSSRKEKERVVEEIINHKFMTAEKKEALRRKFQKEWEEEQKNKKARAGFVVEKGEGGKKIFDKEEGYVATYPVIDLEDLLELRLTLKEDDAVPACIWDAAYNIWGDIVLDFKYEDWIAEIHSQIEERTSFEHVSPKSSSKNNNKPYPTTDGFDWEEYKTWDAHPDAILDLSYCVIYGIDVKEVLRDLSKLTPSKFYLKWGFQVEHVSLPEHERFDPVKYLKYEDCRSIMHMTMRSEIDDNDFYGKEAGFSKIELDDSGNWTYIDR